MPPVAAAVAAYAFTSATAIFVAELALNIGIAYGLSAASKELAKKKRPTPNFGLLEDRLITIRQAIAPRKVIYGQTRVDGVIAFMHSTGANQVLYITVTFSGHPVFEIGDIYFDDELIPLDANGDATGRLAGFCTIKKGLGTTAGDAEWLAWKVAEVPDKWTTAHTQTGCSKITAKLTFSREKFKGGIPNITAIIKGAIMTDPRTGTEIFSQNAALVVRDYLTDADYGVEEPASRINDTQLNAQANICDEQENVRSTADVFTADATADELTLVASGTPASIKMIRFDPGDGVLLATAGTLPDPLFLGTKYYVIPTGAVTMQLAATYQDALDGIAVDLTDAGTGAHTVERVTQPRYVCNGSFTVDQTPEDILQGLLSSMGGFAGHMSGKWNLFAAAWRTPKLTINEDDLVAPLQIGVLVERRELFNGVKGVFISPQDLYQPIDFPAVTNSTYLAEDGGERLWSDIDYSFTNSPGMAQRISKIELEKVRQQLTIAATLGLRGLEFEVGNTLYFDNTRMGWTQKEFEVVDLEFASIGTEEEPALGVKLLLRETAAAVYDWNNGEETLVDLAPNTTLPDPFNLPAPGNLQLDSGDGTLFIAPSGGTVISRILATWDAPSDGFNDGYEIQFKKASNSNWDESTAQQVDTSRALVGPVEDGIDYDVRVRAFNVLGSRSDWTNEFSHTVIGKAAKPGQPDTFNVEEHADGTRRYSWSHADPDPDVKAGGGYLMRYFLGSTTSWGGMTALHEGILTLSPFENNDLASGTYTFAIKSVDSSGNESTNAVFASDVALGDPRIEHALVQRNERVEGWPGTIVSGFVYYNGELVATSAQTIADLPATIGGLASQIDSMLTNNSPMDYTTPTIDLGSDFVMKPIVSVQGSGTWTITVQTGTTADGAPTGAFIAPALKTARYIKIKVSTAGTTPRLSSMVTIIDSPAKVETYEDVATASATDSWFESIVAGHFKIKTRGGISKITQASINAIQNVAAGFSSVLIDKNAGFGADLVLNGDFPTDLTSWTSGDSGTGVSSQTAGVMRLNGGASGVAQRYQTIAGLTIGQNVQVRVDVATNAADITIDGDTLGDGAHLALASYAVGSHIIEFVAAETSATLVFSNAANNNADIDNVIMRDGDATAEFKIYDNTNTLADATVDVILRGSKV